MQAETLFYIIIGILVFDFILERTISYLNARHFDDDVPKELEDVYDKEEYLKSQAYKKENYRFSMFNATLNFIGTLVFFAFDGFAWLDGWARTWTDSEVLIALIFFGSLGLITSMVSIPFSYYHNFVIEEKYGFNKSSRKLFFMDKIKGTLVSGIIGAGILSLFIWFYQWAGQNFWIYAWITIAGFSVLMTLFYSNLIVPLFNKQTPLEEGDLKSAIKRFADKMNFTLRDIYVIDGSKRSTKANAYFSGFGAKKRIVLYDTLIDKLEHQEVVAVLAHEVGHYKRKHVLINMVLSILLTGFTLFILSLLIGNELLSNALGVQLPSFHIGLVTFGILYSPISEITGMCLNALSRKFEYEADDFARDHHDGTALVSSLKKLSKTSLSNLTPHSWHVFMHYSHPTLYQRIVNLNR